MRARDILIVMTRFPREGENKTRLIPALGAAGATAFHDRLARHVIGRASSYIMMHPGSRMQVHLDSGTPADGRAWLGEVDCQPQSDGDLGRRMQSAVDLAFSKGARRVLVIGTDCPSIDEALLERAFDALDHVDLVFGPAADGGYYLVGLSRPCPAIFHDIEWGGPQVLNKSLTAARESGFNTSLLEVLSDVDVPEDLASANVVLTAGTSLSVIIPTLNEEVRLPLLLDQLKQCGPHEIIPVDGSASQMNRVAAMATGEFLLFLNAGILPALECQQWVNRVLKPPAASAGMFRVEFKAGFTITPLIESPVILSWKVLDTPHAIEGLIIRRRIFQYACGCRSS